MRAVNGRICALLLVTTATLSGCGNPYALKINDVNYKPPQTAGSITFTDPKLYRREALINERREEVAYLTAQVEGIGSVNFTPEVIRELQSITTLSASVGLKFDPAAGLKYQRDKETSDIQQEMAVLRLQLQLDQLRRDAELMRVSLPAQQAPVNTDLGTSAAGGTVGVPASAVTPNTVADLVQSVDSLKAALQTALSTKGEPLSAVNAAASPFDTFNDRAAYRNLINAARNAASLDELHDKDGAALIRLNLTATVLPPIKDYSATFGRLQMTVAKPTFGRRDQEVNALYRDWLWRISEQLSIPVYQKDKLTGFRSTSLGATLGVRNDLYDLAYYDFAVEGVASCPGVNFDSASKVATNCMRIAIAVPKIELNGLSQYVPGASYRALYDKFARKSYSEEFSATADTFAEAQRLAPFKMGAGCGLPEQIRDRPVLLRGVDVGLKPPEMISLAAYAQALVRRISQVENEARAIARQNRIDPNTMRSDPPADSVFEAAAAAGSLSDLVFASAGADCQQIFSDVIVGKIVPDRFLRTLGSDNGRVAVYQLGPKERVQVVSSMARAAEAISLAASISGQIPGNGIGADGNVAYGRSAIGKADALERVPLVVAYAEARGISEQNGVRLDTQPVFGWLMGPRTTLDAKKKQLRLEQALKPYDLSVDLSAPGWWPYLDLDVETTWAPNWKGKVVPGGGEPDRRRIRVPLAPTTADLDSITNRLLETTSLRVASIEKIVPGALSACALNATLEVVGENIWRGTQVIIGGRMFDAASVAVLPDMRGLLVKLDKAEFPVVTAKDRLGSADVAVLTPYGPARDILRLTNVASGGTCVPTPAAGAKAAK
jgi:hypothetical protein